MKNKIIRCACIAQQTVTYSAMVLAAYLLISMVASAGSQPFVAR